MNHEAVCRTALATPGLLTTHAHASSIIAQLFCQHLSNIMSQGEGIRLDYSIPNKIKIRFIFPNQREASDYSNKGINKEKNWNIWIV